MAVQVNPITQSLPATTAIQDPAVRRFAQAVEDALRALRSEEGAVESLKKAADAMNNAVAGGTPPSIAQWLFSSELYQKLTTEIARVDVEAKQRLLDEALARSQAIQEIQAALAEIESTPAYDPATTYQIGDLVTYDNKLYRAKAETTGNLPTNTAYWDKVGDYATLGDVVAAHTLQLSEIESDIIDIGGDLAAEITARDTLATQLRGTYTGTDVAMVSQGLLYSERQARVNADGVTVSNLNALRAQVGVTETGTLTEGFILNEQTIRNTNDLAIVSAVNTALAQITGVSTSISQSGENLVATWSQAQAQKWSQIEAEVLTAGGQTIRSALQQESDARASFEGKVSASWMIKAQIDVGTGQPYVAGIALGAEGQGGQATSKFVVRADAFAMVMPGYGEYVPFAIGDFGPSIFGEGGFSVPVNDIVAQAAQPSSFMETFESGNLSQWTNHSGGGELSVVAAADSLTGGKVLRIGNNSGNDQAWLIHKRNIPFDPSALYRIKFRVRRTAGTGAVYLGVAGVAADGATWVRNNGANSTNGQHYVAASNQNPGTDWTEYVGYIKGTATTGQSGTNPPVTAPLKLHQNVRYIRPLILANYDGAAGITEVDYCSIELMTDAMSWDVISGAGKPEDGATVGAPAGTLVAGVPAANVATAVTDFNASNNRNGAVIAAPTIPTDGTAVDHVAQKDGSVDISFEWAWGGVEGDIDGFLVFARQSASATAYTFGTNAAEETVYTVPASKRAFILFGVAADQYYTFGVQAYRAVDKAVNAAGVIKSALVKATGAGENPYRPRTSVAFTGDVTGTVGGTAAATLVSTASTALTNANNARTEADKANASLADIAADNKLTPAEKKSVRKEWDAVYAERAGIRAQADSFGITTEKTNYDNDFQALGTYLNGGTAYTIGATPPSWIADANLATTTTIVGSTFRNNWKNLYADRQALLNKISAEAAKKADWSSVSGKTGFAALDGKITSGNVTTYIDLAAIGNAQIGGDIWSSNYVYNSSGWYLQRDGNLYCANAFVRGDVEASSLKANTAMVNSANIVNAAVNTLQIAGEAVTVPRSVYTAGAISFGSSPVTLQSIWMNPEGGSVCIVGKVYVTVSQNTLTRIALVAPNGSVLDEVVTSQNDTITLVSRSTQSGTYIIIGNLPSFGANSTASNRALLAIGGKR